MSQYRHLILPYLKGTGAMVVMMIPVGLVMYGGYHLTRYVWPDILLSQGALWQLPYLIGFLSGLTGLLIVVNLWGRTQIAEYIFRMEHTSETLDYPLRGEE